MTEQITNDVLLDASSYAICGVKGEGLFDPAAQLALSLSKTNGSKLDHTCTFAVQDGQLQLMTTGADGDVFEQDPFPDSENQLEDVFELGHPSEPAPSSAESLDVFEPMAPDNSSRVKFTGKLLLGKRFITNIQLGSGFPPPYTFRDVKELTFDRGVLTEQVDRSEEMLEARIERATDGNSGWKEPDQWVEGAHSLEY